MPYRRSPSTPRRVAVEDVEDLLLRHGVDDLLLDLVVQEDARLDDGVARALGPQRLDEGVVQLWGDGRRLQEVLQFVLEVVRLGLVEHLLALARLPGVAVRLVVLRRPRGPDDTRQLGGAKTACHYRRVRRHRIKSVAPGSGPSTRSAAGSPAS